MTGLQALQSLRTDPKSATLPFPLRPTNFESLHRKITLLTHVPLLRHGTFQSDGDTHLQVWDLRTFSECSLPPEAMN